MSVTPRTLRAVTLPAAPRLRRTPRPFGTISLFLAATKYGMSMPADPSTVHQIDVPGPVVTKVVAVPAPIRSSGVRLGVGTTDVVVTSWWQEAWVVLYKLLR